MNVLQELGSAIASGRVRVVDLTQTLSPEFPSISLPPEMGQAWPFRIEEVSRYDERGPAWYWNNFSCGEHTGTHFDAPIHWVSGKDLPHNAVDSIPPERFIGAAYVVDCSKQAAKDADFLLTRKFLVDWEKKHEQIAPAALASAVVKALQDGVEDVYPGDVAQEWLARWRDNPKALERELSA